MPAPDRPQTGLYRIDAFELDLRAGELRRGGVRVPLQDLPLRLLGILAERAGEVVTREEIQQGLWPDRTFVDFEDGLNTAVRKLRQALDDDPRQPRCIETIRRYGYRLLLPVEAVARPAAQVGGSSVSAAPLDQLAGSNGAHALLVSESSGVPADGAPRTPRRRWLPWSGGAIAAVLALLGLWWTTPLSPPTVVAVTQLTTQGRVGYCLRTVTEGGRLFYINVAGDHWELMQTSLAGGDSSPGPSLSPSLNTAIFDVSPDGTQLLAGTYVQRGEAMPLWILPVQGGAPLRLGDVTAQSAVWSHDGRTIAYVRGHDLWLVSPDGRNPRVLVTMNGDLDWPGWSPDDAHLRFTYTDPLTDGNSIWDTGADGRGLRQILTGWSNPPSERYGSWSADGRYYFFNSFHEGHNDVWALREPTPFWRRSPPGPFRLTEGPLNAIGAASAPDGRHVYFCGSEDSFQMTDVDPATSHVRPFLPSINPRMAVYSSDGSWIAYTQGTFRQLWIARADGADPHRLLLPAMGLWFPRISPDGQTIALTGKPDGETAVAYTIGRDGGHLTPLAPQWQNVWSPDWSPDGRTIVLTHADPADLSKQRHVMDLVDVRTHATTPVPESSDVGSPRWSPTGRYIAAESDDGLTVRVFDFASHRWHEVGRGKLMGVPVWSRDGQYVYFQDRLASGEPIYRVRPERGAPERVAEFSSVLKDGAASCAFIGVAPDGHILVDMRRSAANLYALDVR